MNIVQIVASNEDREDSGDHEYRGDFHSDGQPSDNYGPEDVTEDDAMNSPVEASEVLGELQGQVDQIDQAEEALEEAENAVGVIDDVTGVLQEQEEQGKPVTDAQVDLIEATHESLMYRLGLNPAFPTMESVSFADRHTTIVASLESERKSLFAKIADAVKYAANQVVEFIAGVVRNSWVLGKYLDYVQKRVRALDKSAKAQAEDMKASAKQMSVDGKADFDSVKQLTHGATELLSRATAAVNDLAATNFKFGDVNPNVEVAKFVPAGAAITGGSRVTPISVLTGTKIYKIEPGAEAATAKVLNPGQMNEALVSAGKIITAIKAFDASNGRIKRFVSNLTQYVAQAAVTLGAVVSRDAKEKEREMAYLRGFRMLLSSVIGKFPLEAFRSAKAIIDYVRNSLRQYDGVGKVDQAPAT